MPHTMHIPASLVAVLTDQAPAWQDDALCAQTDPDAFFPEQGVTTAAARAVCAQCPVRAQCLQHALDNDERYGVWGGTTERQRRRLRDTTPMSSAGAAA